MTFLPRRALVGAATTGALLLTMTACANDSSSPQESSSAPRSETSASGSPSSSDRSTPMDIRVTLDGEPVDATLNSSPAARDLATLLPLAMDLKDFQGTERIADLPRRLTTNGAPEPTAAKVGDIAYFAPWGNLGLFYEDGPSASENLLILGHIDVGADQLSQADRITIKAAS